MIKLNCRKTIKALPFWRVLIVASILLLSTNSKGQSPGTIVNPRNTSITFLNPNGDKFSSKTPAGYTNNDLTQSEIPYVKVPAATPEPTGDQNAGPTGGSTDFVANPADGNGFYTYYDGTNVMFRFRLGSMPKGSKGFSVLIDTDLRIGLSGFYADPNFVAQNSSRSGNPGFELEIVYDFGKNVTVNNVDGSVTGTLLATYPESSNAQTSIALSRVSGDADYFVDFGVPASILGPIQYIRIVGTTGTSSGSALSNNAADVFGINDIPLKNLIPNWETVISSQCGFPVSAISLNGTGICMCTPRPVINAPINVGVNVTVSGTWNRLDPSKSSQAIITIFKNEAIIGTTIATTGIPWSFVVPQILSGDQFYAKAQAPPEFMCLQSDPVFALCSSSLPAAPTITCASTNGIQGTIPLNATVVLYEVTGTNNNPTYTPLTGGISYQPNGTNQVFTYYGSNPQTSNQCVNGNANLNMGSYSIQTNASGCVSPANTICIYGNQQNDWGGTSLNFISLNNPIYNTQKSITGSGATVGSLLRLYINNIYVSSIIAGSTSFAFNNVSLQIGDVIRITHQSTAAGSCLTVSWPYTVQCFTYPPVIWTNTDGRLISTATSITGSCNSIGATITLYQGAQPNGAVVTTTTVDSKGLWEINGLTLIGGETYYADANAGCGSAVSNQVDIIDPEPVCAFISGSYTESSSPITGTFASNFTGTLRLYLDSIVVKTLNVNNKNTWSIPVSQLSSELYPGGKLKVTTQSVGWGERSNCQAAIPIACDMPVTPIVNPTSVTINQGETATFSVANSESKFFYSLVDGANSAYATSKFGNNGAQTIVSNNFNTPGTYNLQVMADNLSGGTCSATTNVMVTVNNVVLPLKFINVSVEKTTNGSREVKWIISTGEEISHYQVERSLDCIKFETIATVSNQAIGGEIRKYIYEDARLYNSKIVCYRIKAISVDGKMTYSQIVSTYDDINFEVKLAPNPATSGSTIFYNSQREGILQVSLVDLNGRTVFEQWVNVNKGLNTITLSKLSRFAKGQYVVKMKTTSETKYAKLQIQ